jgi:hypothetical protein
VTVLKSIVVFLALANVGYFLWAQGIAKAPAGPSATGSTLKLASESPVVARPQTARNDAGHADAAITAGTAIAAETAQINGAHADATRPAGTAAGSAGGVAASIAAATQDGSPPALLTNVKRCISVGPFRDVAEASRSAQTLRGGGYDPRQRVAEGEVWAGVWVYLPMPSTRAAGDQILARLKTGGIDDALEMPGPNDTPVISLGLFSEPKRAEARVAQAQSLGLNPGIADRKRTGDVYWIDIDLKPTDGLLNPSDLQGESGHIVRLQVTGCPAAP